MDIHYILCTMAPSPPNAAWTSPAKLCLQPWNGFPPTERLLFLLQKGNNILWIQDNGVSDQIISYFNSYNISILNELMISSTIPKSRPTILTTSSVIAHLQA